MEKWRCTPCDYVYDPEVGDPDNGIAPGTPWEEVPDDWLCPDCSLGKDFFERVEGLSTARMIPAADSTPDRAAQQAG